MTTMKITKPVVIHVPIETLYRNFVASVSDIIWDDHNLIRNNDFMEDFRVLAKEDVEGIRSLFQQGHTMMLLAGSHVQIVEDNHSEPNEPQPRSSGVEIRLYDRKGDNVGVILNNEINY